MPSKDDDDPASTKDVVTKRQKQLLNREEMDLNLIAESLDGVLLEELPKSRVFRKNNILNIIFGKGSRKDKGKGSRTVSPSRLGGGRPGAGGGDSVGTRGSSSRPGPRGGYQSVGGGGGRPPANAAAQAQVPKGEMTRIRARTTPSAQPSGASGGDAGSIVRSKFLQRAGSGSGSSVLRSLGRFKNLRGGFATAAVMQVLDQPTRQLGDYLGGQFARALASTMSDKDKAKVAQKAPSLVGYQGPDFTPDMAKSIEARDKQASIDYWTSPEVQTQLAQTVARQNQTKTEPKTETEVQKSSTNKVKVDQTTTDKPTQVSPQAVAAPTIAGVLRGTRTGRGRRPSEPRKDKKGKFKISPPGYGGKIGRRVNPQ